MPIANAVFNNGTGDVDVYYATEIYPEDLSLGLHVNQAEECK
jgi:hypothetical protein